MAVPRKALSDIKDLLQGSAENMRDLQALVIPRMTTTARDALTAAQRPEGLLIYNTTTHKLNIRVAAAWEVVTSA